MSACVKDLGNEKDMLQDLVTRALKDEFQDAQHKGEKQHLQLFQAGKGFNSLRKFIQIIIIQVPRGKNKRKYQRIVISCYNSSDILV